MFAPGTIGKCPEKTIDRHDDDAGDITRRRERRNGAGESGEKIAERGGVSTNDKREREKGGGGGGGGGEGGRGESVEVGWRSACEVSAMTDRSIQVFGKIWMLIHRQNRSFISKDEWTPFYPPIHACLSLPTPSPPLPPGASF